MTRKIVSEMTYNVSMGTLNPTKPYHTIPYFVDAAVFVPLMKTVIIEAILVIVIISCHLIHFCYNFVVIVYIIFVFVFVIVILFNTAVLLPSGFYSQLRPECNVT